VVVGVFAVVLWPGEREPEYEGRTLFQWLDQYKPYTGFLFVNEGPERGAAVDAIRHIGTNGLPWMLRWLRCYDEPSFGDRLLAAHGKVPPWLHSQALERYMIRHSGRAHADAGFSGILILGKQARPALPELARLAADRNAPRTANCAGFLARAVSFDYEPRHVGDVPAIQAAVVALSTNASSTNAQRVTGIRKADTEVVH
jgi:hypothetical protein